MRRRIRTATSALVLTTVLATLLAGCAPGDVANADSVPGIIPLPDSYEPHTGDEPFRLTESTRIVVEGDAGSPAVADVAELLAARLRIATGYEIPVLQGEPETSLRQAQGTADIALALGDGGDPSSEAYALEVGDDGVRITADAPAGLFWGVQSLRQLLPAEIDGAGAAQPDGGWVAPAVSIEDSPRFSYRAASLDVARHFFPVDDVKRYIDEIAALKLNVLQLHLTDDQGWRIRIDSWPKLTEVGGQTSVELNGSRPGFYTKDDYREIVEYAAARFVTIVPEIDLPGHTNAALHAYPELTCDGVDPGSYAGIDVGFSSLCAAPERAEVTDRFLADVLGELAAMTPGPWIHVGGDEAHNTPKADYVDLVNRITSIAAATGKTVVGWHEMGASTSLPDGMIGGYWGFTRPEGDSADLAKSFVDQGGKLLMMPADVAYMDMVYPDRPQNALGHSLGLEWAQGATTIEEAYGWEPTAIVPGVDEDDILGVVAALWTETITSIDDAEFMVFPRAAGIAEIGWSPKPPEPDQTAVPASPPASRPRRAATATCPATSSGSSTSARIGTPQTSTSSGCAEWTGASSASHTAPTRSNPTG
ncbi:beta-N-acetylhexosaminidase [Agromyces protaetiae]|uniref:beta-N-acetylhexosaminidase n=1 Tax=Agromyces protaetiae TaxID=2509455 RepID=A0A4P6FBW4_9MICO|nr:beta-N-acetylhexosaminidase [Agromyces protaetiae]QAY73265.1 beta-N-acetylhexosaminidase [Agromyces protaetiae]